MGEFHIGRSFGGPGPMEADCPCLKAACGLVAEASDDCDQHGPRAMRTIRSGHDLAHCPAPRAALTTDPSEASQDEGGRG